MKEMKFQNVKDLFLKMWEVYRKEANFQELNQYRLLEIIEEKNAQIQVVGKGIVLTLPIEELMHSKILLGFSKADIAIITHLGTKHEAKEAIRFTVNSSDLVGLRTVVTFQGADNGAVYRKTAEEIMYDAKLLVQFSKEDLRSIIFAAAQDQYRIEETL